MTAEEKITEGITEELSNITWRLCKAYLGVELNSDVDESKIQLQRLINEADESSVISNIYYGVVLVGSVKISMNEDFSTNFEVASKYNDITTI